VSEVEILPYVSEGCAELRRRGFVLVVVTNQPEVARGSLSRRSDVPMMTRMSQSQQVLLDEEAEDDIILATLKEVG